MLSQHAQSVLLSVCAACVYVVRVRKRRLQPKNTYPQLTQSQPCDQIWFRSFVWSNGRFVSRFSRFFFSLFGWSMVRQSNKMEKQKKKNICKTSNVIVSDCFSAWTLPRCVVEFTHTHTHDTPQTHEICKAFTNVPASGPRKRIYDQIKPTKSWQKKKSNAAAAAATK